jgi:hypothetical protein
MRFDPVATTTPAGLPLCHPCAAAALGTPGLGTPVRSRFRIECYRYHQLSLHLSFETVSHAPAIALRDESARIGRLNSTHFV